MTKFYFIILTSMLAIISISAEAGKPKWVKKRPSETQYYIGIGMAYKTDAPGLDYAKKARAEALRELVSEIEVTVSSNSLLHQFENNYEFKETFESRIATSAEENLTGYEVQTWENKKEYWVMMRLNKEQYHRRKQLDLEMAKKKAASYLIEARQHVNNLEITAALTAYFKAIEALENHLKDDLTYRSIDGNINFGTDIMNDLRQLFSKISITPLNPVYQVAFSKTMEKPLIAQIEFFAPTGQKVPVKNFPVKFQFIQGQGVLQEKAVSNPEGFVESYIQKLNSSLKKQKVTVCFDQSALLQEENINSPLVNFFIPNTIIPEASFDIELQKSTAWFAATEKVFGQHEINQPFAKNLKADLNDTFFNFTRSPESASYIVEASIIFKKGEVKKGYGYEVYLVYADLHLSITERKSGIEIFSETITGVKGMRPGSYDYALKEASTRLLQKFRAEIYPKLEVLNL
jgi:hypothetical protein